MAAPLLAMGLVPFVSKIMLQRTEEECSEPPAPGIRVADVVLLDNPFEETLRQVLRRMGIVTAPPDIGIERIPISAAKLFQGLRTPW